MIEYLIFGIIALTIFLVVVAMAILYNKKLNFDQEQRYNNFRLAKKRLSNASKSKSNLDEEDIEDDVQDFIDSMPKWLLSILEGAGIDIEKLYFEDAGELQKVQNILSKIPLSTSQTNTAKDLIG